MTETSSAQGTIGPLAPSAAGKRAARLRYLVAYDFTRASDRPLHIALRLRDRDLDSELHVVNVQPSVADVYAMQSASTPQQPSVVALDEQVERRLHERLVGADPPLTRTAIHVLRGRPATQVARLAREVCADVIIVGSNQRHGLRRLLFGSVAEEVVRRAPCPVLVAQRSQPLQREPGDETREEVCRGFGYRRALG